MARNELGRLIMDEISDVHELVAELTDEDWDTPSLCGDWTVMQVAAHLASFVGVQVPGLVSRMARGGFIPARANSNAASVWCGRGRDAIVDAFAITRMPGIGKVYGRVGLAELVIHHQDIRRPLGHPRVVPEASVRVALAVAARWPMGTGARRRRRGVRLRATDIEWSLGDGPLVTGPAEALLMALAGRQQVLSELTGEGLARFSRAVI